MKTFVVYYKYNTIRHQKSSRVPLMYIIRDAVDKMEAESVVLSFYGGPVIIGSHEVDIGDREFDTFYDLMVYLKETDQYMKF
jgi:hypothetical protein